MRQQILRAVYDVLDELNATRPSGERLVKSEDTQLIGAEGQLDSMGVINLLLLCEQEVGASLQQSLSLAEPFMATEGQPETVGAFVDFILCYIEKDLVS